MHGPAASQRPTNIEMMLEEALSAADPCPPVHQSTPVSFLIQSVGVDSQLAAAMHVGPAEFGRIQARSRPSG